jgi:hypothetical protein
MSASMRAADVLHAVLPVGGVLASTDEGLLVAVTAGGSVEEHHPAAHCTGTSSWCPRRPCWRPHRPRAPPVVGETAERGGARELRAGDPQYRVHGGVAGEHDERGSTRATTSSWTSSVHRLKPSSVTSSGPPIARVSSPSMPTTPTVGCAGVSAVLRVRAPLQRSPVAPHSRPGRSPTAPPRRTPEAANNELSTSLLASDWVGLRRIAGSGPGGLT